MANNRLLEAIERWKNESIISKPTNLESVSAPEESKQPEKPKVEKIQKSSSSKPSSPLVSLGELENLLEELNRDYFNKKNRVSLEKIYHNSLTNKDNTNYLLKYLKTKN